MDQTFVIFIVAAVGFGIVVAVGFAFAGGRTSQERAVQRAQSLTAGRPDARRARGRLNVEPCRARRPGRSRERRAGGDADVAPAVQ